MENWPKIYLPHEAPPEVLALASQLVPLLLAGNHPAIVALRAQYAVAQITSVELTGVGFFVNYKVPEEAPRAVPSDFAGGNAYIELAGVNEPSGCVLFVHDGKLALLEGYTFAESWPEHTQVLAITQILPLTPP